MASQDDCYYFYNSTCTKGADCSFRHEPLAIGNPACDQWKAGLCQRNPCHFRHADPELTRSPAPCFFESQPSGCLNSGCQFAHAKLIHTNYNPRPIPRPLLHVPFQPGFRPPNSQMFGHTFTHPRLIPPPHKALRVPTRSQTPYHPSGGPRPLMFHITADLPIERVRPNVFNHNALLRTRSSVAQQDLFRPSSLLTGPLEAGDATQHPTFKENASNRQAMNVTAGVTRAKTGDGLLPLPTSGLPFPLPAIFPFNMSSPSPAKDEVKSHSSARSAYRRTVKKYEGIRNRRSSSQHEKTKTTQQETEEKPSKRRTEKKESQADEKKKKKVKKSSSKTDKDNTSKDRKVKRSRSVRSHVHRADGADEKEEAEEDTYEEINLGFKVKTLEEILRDKALKKFLERQNENSDVSATECGTEPEQSTGESTGVESTNADDDMATRYSIDEAEQNEEANKVECVKPQIKKMKPLKPLKPLARKKSLNMGGEKIENMAGQSQDCKQSDQKKPLPPLKRLKPLAKTLHGRTTVKVLKRKLEIMSDVSQAVPSNKVQKVERDDDADSHNQVSTSKGVLFSVETSSDKEIASKNTPLRKPKRTIVLQSVEATARKPIQVKPATQIKKAQELRKNDLNTLTARAEPKTSESYTKLNKPDGGENSKEELHEENPVQITTATEVLSQKRPVNTNRKPIGKIIKLNTASSKHRPLTTSGIPKANATVLIKNRAFTSLGMSSRTNIELSKDSQSLTSTRTNDEVLNDETKPLTRTEIGGTNTVVENVKNEEVDRASQQDGNINTNDEERPTELSKKPLKTIKLNRDRLMEKQTDSQSAGKSGNPFRALGRKMKVNKAPKQAVVEPVSVNTSSTAILEQDAGSTTNVKTSEDSNMLEKSEVKCEDRLGKATGSISLSRNDNTQSRSSGIVAKTDPKQPGTARIKPTATAVEAELSVTPKMTSDEEAGAGSNQNEERRNTLDRLFEEVSEGIEDEGEDFLNEALEKAIAELSPVNTDDEDDVSNADDLLLEIEEMINS